MGGGDIEDLIDRARDVNQDHIAIRGFRQFRDQLSVAVDKLHGDVFEAAAGLEAANEPLRGGRLRVGVEDPNAEALCREYGR